MRTFYLPLCFFLLWSACDGTKSGPATNASENGLDQPVSGVVKEPTPAVPAIQLDSIDKANNDIVMASGSDVTKAFVFLKTGDSIIHLTANIRKDHRMFGYAEPNLNSEKLILLSVFTNDVENNPFGCQFGAYYDTQGMEGMKLNYKSLMGDFVKADLLQKDGKKTAVYFEKKWISFE